MTVDARARTLRITIAAAWILGLASSWRLWTASRLFPLAPVSDALPRLDPPLDLVIFALFIALLLVSAIRPSARIPAIAALALAVALALQDQMRWQPWFYLYVAMFAASVSLPAAGALDTCRTILASTYVWSGLQKLNATFVRQTWPDVVASLHGVLPRAMARPPAGMALVIPAIEILAGLGLLTRRFRTPAVALAIITHAAILTTLVGSRENTVVWPWNAAMIVLVVILFWRNTVTRARDLILPPALFQRGTIVLFGLMPALSFAGRWDAYLSFALYSGNTYQAVIYMNPPTLYDLPPEVRPAIWQQTQPFFLDINRWAYQELNVPAYPEPRIYRLVTERVCQWSGDADGVKLRVLGPPNILTGARASELYDCQHLAGPP
jgi:hypothetical protein